jgi:hypothetical protein
MTLKGVIHINRLQVHVKGKLIIVFFACLNFHTFRALVVNPYDETIVNVLIWYFLLSSKYSQHTTCDIFLIYSSNLLRNYF